MCENGVNFQFQHMEKLVGNFNIHNNGKEQEFKMEGWVFKFLPNMVGRKLEQWHQIDGERICDDKLVGTKGNQDKGTN